MLRKISEPSDAPTNAMDGGRNNASSALTAGSTGTGHPLDRGLRAQYSTAAGAHRPGGEAGRPRGRGRCGPAGGDARRRLAAVRAVGCGTYGRAQGRRGGTYGPRSGTARRRVGAELGDRGVGIAAVHELVDVDR